MKKLITPKNKKELQEIVAQEIALHGNQCDLNHIDTSLITDLSYLFAQSKFNGDISKWNTSKVIDMRAMFYKSSLTNSVEGWSPYKLEQIDFMFDSCVMPIPSWFIEDKVKRDEYLHFRAQSILENDILSQRIKTSVCDNQKEAFKL